MQDGPTGYSFVALILILLANGFFAGAEVALVSVRQSRLKQLAAEGQAGAKAALSLLENPERLLSVVQVGVTLASLGLGWAGEETLFAAFNSLLGALITPSNEVFWHGLSFALSFLLMTYAHVVVGEVVPKNLAIEQSDRLAALVAPPLLVFYRASAPFVWVIERSSAAVSRALGVKETLGGGHSAEELKFIISASRRHGHLASFEENAIGRLLDMQDYLVREIMVPRSEIVSAPVDAGLDEVLGLMHDHQFSRIPVYEGEPERIIGVVHYRELLAVWHERRQATAQRKPVRKFDLRRWMREPFVVPETKPLNQMVDAFREKRSHMAIVVDEFGTVVGLVTLEDALEQIFGEIEDEYDVHLPLAVEQVPVLELDGTTSIRDLETLHAIELPVDAGFETLAGFLLHRLRRIPVAGETVVGEGYRFTVLEMERNRIARVRLERMPEALSPEDDHGG